MWYICRLNWITWDSFQNWWWAVSSPRIQPTLLVPISRSIMANLWHTSRVTHHVLGDMPTFTNLHLAIFLKAHPILAHVLEASGPSRSHLKGLWISAASRTSENHTKMRRAFVCFLEGAEAMEKPSPKPLQEWRPDATQNCRRGLSIEREHNLRVSSIQQILGITHVIRQYAF